MQALLRDFHWANRGGGNAAQFHCLREHMQGIRRNMLRGVMVVPLRDPVEIYRSWRRRGRSVSYLREQLEILSNGVHGYDPIYVPLDHGDRDMQLLKVEEAFGIKLQTDWAPVGHREVEVELEPHFLAEAKEWRQVPPFRRYYGDLS